MNKRKLSLVVAAAVLGIAIFICWRPAHNKMSLINGNQTMRQEIIKRIPIGSSINQAQRIMKASGFRCSAVKNNSFVECAPNGLQKYHAGINYLYCDQSASEDLFFSRRWQVAIVDKQGIVSDVYVSISIDGL